ncbi:MAG: hypothetical protein QOF26_1, partial [Baekduia sp.]|nr:hypothetical protein [Baekduia sp.]
GEATGAALNTGASLRRVTALTDRIQDVPYAKLLANTFLKWRGVTLTAVDSAGARSSVTHTVPLVPDQPPKLQAAFVNRDPNARTFDVFRPHSRIKVPLGAAARRPAKRAHGAATSSQSIQYPLTTADELAFDASASSDPDGTIAYYTLEVGQPLLTPGLCNPKGPPLAVGGNGPISLDGPEDGYGPGQFFGAGPGGGAGPAIQPGIAGSLPGATLNPRGLQQAGFRGVAARARAAAARATPSKLPTLATLMGTHPLVHPCVPYANRNVVPEPFKVRASAAARPLLHGSVPSPLLTPLKGLENDTTALVTKDPANLRFRIPVAGHYSVAVSAYDDAGLGATQRTDGFEIVDTSGTCQNIAGQELTVLDTALDKRKVVFSGQCMDFGGKHRRFWTRNAIDINGVELRPTGTSALYLQLDGPTKWRVFSTRAPKPAGFAGDDPYDNTTLGAMVDKPGAVDVVADGDLVARFDHFSAKDAQRFLANDHSVAPVIPAEASYHGSALARPDAGTERWDAFAVRFDTDGRSTMAFRIVLPSQFSRDDAGTRPTADVVRPGLDEPRSAPLTTNTYADIAKHRRAHAAATGAGPRAHAALNVNGSLDLSGTTLGPVSIQHGSLVFDVARGLWKGDIDEALLTLGPKIVPVTFHILIDNGELKEARGSAGVKIPIFSGVDLDEVRFAIVTDPLTMSGGATFSFGQVLKGDLDLTVRVDPVFLRLQGRIRMASLELGGGFVQYDVANGKTLTFGGHFGVNFGPASLEAGLEGGISFQTGDFYIQGGGHACLWICLGVQALASNIAVAGCGSIDLFVGEISAGVAYKFGEGLDLFTGCDLEPYKPAIFRAQAADAGPVAPPGLTIAPGTEQAAFKFYGDPGAAGAPRLSLTAPDGRVFTTAAAPGDYAFSPPEPAGLVGRPAGTVKAATALIDQNPVDHVSTILVANPAAGEWHVTPADGSPAPARVELAVGHHIADSTLKAPVVPAKLTSAGVRIGKASFRAKSSAAGAAATSLRPSALRALRRVAPLEVARLRGAVVDVPKGLTGKMIIIDASPHASTIVGSIDVATTNGRVPIVFDPSTEAGTHELRAFLTHADGVPRQQTVIDRFTSPALPKPSAPRLDLHRDRHDRAYVDVTPGTAGTITDPEASFELVLATSAGQRIERSIDGRLAEPLSDGRFRIQLGTLGGAAVKMSGRMRYGAAVGRGATDRLTGAAVLRGR